jgi:DNA modification methylase
VKIVNKIILGSALDKMKDLDDEFVDSCVTSPLYWSPWAHPKTKLVAWAPFENHQAWKGELSLEPTPDMYIAHLMQIFDQVKRVLKKQGSCWVVMGDVLVNKTLKLIPEQFAIEMTKRGWYLRSKIIWYKSNKPMPSRIKDRFNKDWDYIFHFTRKSRYYFDTQSKLPINTKMQSVWDVPLTPKVKNYIFEAFPVELVTIPILTTCPKNGIVLDPFIGSGTTAVAALELCRNFIGIEISEASVNIASNRIKPYLKHDL